jgi:ABC-type multidrug transport system ATPase subunit
VIEFDSVSKVYRPLVGRPITAIRELTISLSPGEVLGLAGPNGAGKSTLIGLILGFLRPTAGRVTIEGTLPREYVERNGIGYLSELVAIPPGWTVESALQRYALLAGLADDAVSERVERAIARLGLAEHRHKRIKQLSKGSEQRVGLAQALLRDERVLILDEPTHGLDPVWTQRFRDLVTELRAPHRLIVIASHNLDELERVADRVAILDRGSLQRLVDLREASGNGHARRYRVVMECGDEIVAAIWPAAMQIAPHEFEVTVTSIRALNDALGALIARGATVREVAPVHSSLERHFREAVRQPTS